MVCNNSSESIYVYDVIYAVAGTNLTLDQLSPVPTFEILPGCTTMAFKADGSNSANQAFSFTLTLVWGHTPVQGADPTTHANFVGTYSVGATPPDCPCPK